MKTPKALFLSLIVRIAIAQTPTPTFTDYPVPTEQVQATHKVLIQSPQSRRYATMLRDASTHSPDFAGHYILASWGCGASCVMAAAIDAKDGMVVWLPFTVCCWPINVTEPLEYRPDSRLLIVHGQRNEKGSVGTRFYTLDPAKRRFTPVHPPAG